MLSTVILYFLYVVVLIISSPLRLLSDVSQSSFIASSISSISQYLSTGYQLLPNTVNAVLLTWGLFLVFELAIFSYKGIMWLIKKIPFIN